MKRARDQTSDFASAIGATDILVLKKMEVATHKRNAKIYIISTMNYNLKAAIF